MAFYKCSKLESIAVGNAVITIGNHAFYGCSSLTSINIPNSVTSIGKETFSGCSNLTSINIPNSVTTIGDDAFKGCESLTSVFVDCKTVGKWFNKINSLKEVTFGDNVNSISLWAFENCEGLTTITFGAAVTSIAGGAFRNCNKLSSVHCKCSAPPSLSSTSFPSSTPELYVPKGSLTAYKSSDWAKYFNNIVEE